MVSLKSYQFKMLKPSRTKIHSQHLILQAAKIDSCKIIEVDNSPSRQLPQVAKLPQQQSYTDCPTLYYGLTISSYCGKAVFRNLTKRRIKHIFRKKIDAPSIINPQTLECIPNTFVTLALEYCINVVAKKNISQINFSQLELELEKSIILLQKKIKNYPKYPPHAPTHVRYKYSKKSPQKSPNL